MITLPVVPSPFFPNSPEEIKKRVSLGEVRWAAALLFLPARSAFMFLSQGVFAAVYRLRGHASPWQAAGTWWTVYGTLVDVGCLACLFFLTRRERLRIRDLLGVLPRWLVAKGIALFVPYLSLLPAWRASRQLDRLPLLAGAYPDRRNLGAPLASLGSSLFSSDLVAHLVGHGRTHLSRIPRSAPRGAFPLSLGSLLPGGILVGAAAQLYSFRARLAARPLQVSRLRSRGTRFLGDLLAHSKTRSTNRRPLDDGSIGGGDDA